MSDAPTRDEAVEKLAGLIDDIQVCMLTTLDADGLPWSRPMWLIEQSFAGTLWFLTSASSEKTAHLQRNPACGVAFARPDDNEFVVMAGRGEVIDDRAQIRERWSEASRPWFPDGPDDPDLRLLRFDADRAEYWDSPSSFVVYALGYAKAALTGKPAERDAGENQKVDL